MNWFQDYLGRDFIITLLRLSIVTGLAVGAVFLIIICGYNLKKMKPAHNEPFVERAEICKDLTEKYFAKRTREHEHQIGTRLFWDCMAADSTGASQSINDI